MINFSDFCYSELTKSTDYTVTLQGQNVPVCTCRISAYPFNRWWPGHQRQIEQSEVVSFVNIIADEAVTLSVTPHTRTDLSVARVRPRSKNIALQQSGDTLSFTITQSGGYVLEMGDYHGLLYIFVAPPVARPENVTHYFGKGVHFTDKLVLHSGDTVYLDKDAYVYGCIFAKGQENIRLCGNGILDDSNEKRKQQDYMDDSPNGNLKFIDCKNVEIEGIGITNSAIWCVNVFRCTDVHIKDLHVFGQWRYNTDGIDVVNSKRIHIENSFVHSFDDTIVLKGLDNYDTQNNEDMLIENCTLWCDWGKTMEIGLETAAPLYHNITFRNCDVLRGGDTVCDIQNGDYAIVQNITFENINMELDSAYTQSLVQQSDDHVYDKQGTVDIPRIFSITNYRFREYYSFLDLGETRPAYPDGDPRLASVKNVLLKNVNVIASDDLVERFGKDCTRIRIKNTIPTTEYSDITVDGISLNGRPLGKDEVTLIFDGVSPELLEYK